MLTSKKIVHVDLEHEPGEWVKAHAPSLKAIVDCQQFEGIAYGIELAKRCITEWSYPEPVTPENIEDLDSETMAAVVNALLPSKDEDDAKND